MDRKPNPAAETRRSSWGMVQRDEGKNQQTDGGPAWGVECQKEGRALRNHQLGERTEGRRQSEKLKTFVTIHNGKQQEDHREADEAGKYRRCRSKDLKELTKRERKKRRGGGKHRQAEEERVGDQGQENEILGKQTRSKTRGKKTGRLKPPRPNEWSKPVSKPGHEIQQTTPLKQEPNKVQFEAK